MYSLHDLISPLAINESSAHYGSKLAYSDFEKQIFLYHSDTFAIMNLILKKYPEGCFDMIFADPPYFLSNGGFTCHAGKKVSVNKGKWDKLSSVAEMHEFNKSWLAKCQQLLKPNGTIWVSGTMHNIFSVGLAMQELNYKVLNDITWEKPNPPPNLSCRYFTHATETLIWAAKNNNSKHHFNYELMKAKNQGKQMKSVWCIAPPRNNEKLHGKHPTQKPIELVRRCIEASTNAGDLIFDPFAGSSTTGVTAQLYQRGFCGVELEKEFVDLSIDRFKELT